jgi:hypothetical protein
MALIRLAVVALSLATALSAQNLPPGTSLPVQLSSTLNAKSAKPGQKIEGKLMQEVNLGVDTKIKSGSHVTGHIVSATKPGGSGARITLQFDSIEVDGRTIPLQVALRALASSQSVFNAGLPAGAASTYESSTSWTTRQVGGEVVFRGRGYVVNGDGKVGTWDGSGVWGRLPASGDCPAGESTDPQQALWIFSTSACGAYGFERTKVDQAGYTAPLGQIVLTSTKDIDVRGGSGWLLMVLPPSGQP